MTYDPAILGYLGRALSFEFSAVQQYLSLARLMELRGMPQAGQKFRQEAHDEMEHAERIIGKMLALGVAPAATCLKPVQLDGALAQLIQHVIDLEAQIVGFYAQATTYCASVSDHENRLFFEALYREEQQHATSIRAWWLSLTSDEPPVDSQ